MNSPAEVVAGRCGTLAAFPANLRHVRRPRAPARAHARARPRSAPPRCHAAPRRRDATSTLPHLTVHGPSLSQHSPMIYPTDSYHYDTFLLRGQAKGPGAKSVSGVDTTAYKQMMKNFDKC